jgi:superfamily II RNA helicase
MQIEQQYNISYRPKLLNFEYISLLHDLMNDVPIHTVCATHEIFEGNLTRFLLKLLNVVDEVRNIAALSKDTELLKILENIESYEFYKFAMPDSLYLRI